MKVHEPPMTFIEGKAAEWTAGLANQSDDYGKGVYRFASEWATRMERGIAADGADPGDSVSIDKWIAANADRISGEADAEGITGFMFGCAMQMLSAWWIHGERLRRWHNVKTQLGTEGERANESGGVLNPAVLTIGN